MPKGVAITHRSAAALVYWARAAYSPAELAGVLFATSVSFDLSVFELFVPLAWGGRVLLADDVLALPRLAAAGEVRLVNTVPSALAELVREGALPAGVRTVNLAGEPLPRALAAALHALPGVERVWNLYGPSEDTTYSTAALLARGGGKPGIGRPLPGTRAHVLDRTGGRTPIGVPGELFLGGAGLARGYHGRPALTAERFVPDPFGGEPGGRLYRTGDLVRYRPDGELDFLGRVDRQVKIRGFRIEPGEVEAVLARHPAVHQAAVAVREDRPGDRRLVAYVVARRAAPDRATGPSISSEGDLGAALAAWAAERLPAYLVPAALMVLDALPLTPNGKLDRRALPAPEPVDAGAVLPATPFEEMLAAIWAELLGRERVGARDDFFALGGHSLLAARCLARVRDAFGVELPLRSLFEATTVEALARRVEAALAGVAHDGSEWHGGQAPPLAPVPRAAGEPLPLSFAQERLWFLDQLEPGNPAYNMPAALRLRGRLDRPALAAGLAGVVRRHEALRTTFAVVAGRPVAVVHAPAAEALPLVDLAALAGAARDGEERRLAAEEARRAFDLARGPLLRAALLCLAPREHTLLFTLHHAVSDGWSTGVLVREVAALYAAGVAGRPPGLAPLPVQYADYAVWQRRALGDEALAAALARSHEWLAGAPLVLDLPADRPRPPLQSWRGATCAVPLPAGLEGRLAARALGAVATPFMVLLAAFEGLLHRLTGKGLFLVGTTIANRPRRELEDLIGFFVNSLVLRAEVAPELTFAELVRETREAALFAFAHAELPFERLVEELRPERDLSRSPLVQVVFQLLDLPAARLELPGLELAPVEQEGQTAKFDLVVNLTGGAGARVGIWHYRTDLFDRSTVLRLAGQFHTLLAAALAAPDRPIGMLPLLTDGERHQLLVEWGERTDWDGGSPAAAHQPVHARFFAWAARQPDAIALTFEGAGLSYGELARGARGLAAFLAGEGIGPGCLVGLCVERSLDLVLAVLGVLEAGAAYVPLDPGYPRERLAFALADSGMELLLTTAGAAASLPAPPPGLAIVDLAALRGPAASALSPAAPQDPVTPTGPEDLAYVIYTSGSTGRPKGVAVRHAEVARLFDATAPWFDFGPEDVWTLFHSYAFDFSVWELWGALPTAAGWWWCPTGRAARRRPSAACSATSG